MLGRMEKLTTRRFRRNARQWRAILAEDENRGLTSRALATKLGCARGTVERHRSMAAVRQEQARACELGAPAGIPPAFLRVEPPPPPPPMAATATPAVRIELHGGLAIAFVAVPPAAYLATLVRALEGPRC